MNRDYPNLAKPIQIGGLTFRNRMASAPMGAAFSLPAICEKCCLGENRAKAF